MNKFTGYAALFGAGFACCALVQRLGPTFPLAGGNSSVAEAVARLEPAVVNIEVAGEETEGKPSFSGSAFAPTFDGAGSGVIVREDGTLVTNYHVVAPALPKVRRGQTTQAIRVRLADGREFGQTQVVGWDKATDLAVLRLVAQGKPGRFSVAPLGNSDSVRPGDFALAVGNPLGFNSSVSLGIISAVHRRGFRSGPGQTLDSVLQTDAAINPGSSGGALADSTGRVIGITNAIASATGANVGVGFAIPINEAQPIIEALIREGRVVRPFLGVVFAPVWAIEPRGVPKGTTLPKDYGAVLVGNKISPAVVPGSPADKAGLRSFDVLRRVDNQIVGDTRELPRLIARRKVGDYLPLTVWRNGKTLT